MRKITARIILADDEILDPEVLIDIIQGEYQCAVTVLEELPDAHGRNRLQTTAKAEANYTV
jgi:hypothetical protein